MVTITTPTGVIRVRTKLGMPKLRKLAEESGITVLGMWRDEWTMDDLAGKWPAS